MAPESIECTGAAASWCPVCGDCSCPRDPRTMEVESTLDACSLHGSASKHALEPPAEVRRDVWLDARRSHNCLAHFIDGDGRHCVNLHFHNGRHQTHTTGRGASYDEALRLALDAHDRLAADGEGAR